MKLTGEKHSTILVTPRKDKDFQCMSVSNIYINKDFKIIIRGKLLKMYFPVLFASKQTDCNKQYSFFFVEYLQ